MKSGTIENNGEFGYELMPHARPLTLGDFELIMKANFPQSIIPSSSEKGNIFTEVTKGSNSNNIPNQLQ